MEDKLLTVNKDYLSFADRIFNKYKDLYTKQHEEFGNQLGKNIKILNYQWICSP